MAPPVQPVIIIGMHRSGTSLMTRMLEQLGLFVGKDLDRNHEAKFFITTNRSLLRSGGGSWEHPEHFDDLFLNPEAAALTEDYLRFKLRNPPAIRFLGLPKYLKYRDIAKLDRPWGWKDPRTTFTLPIWSRIFPDAKIIHIYRHGVDVAASLRTRIRIEVARGRRRFDKLSMAHGFVPTAWAVSRPAVGSESLDAGLAIWEAYVTRAQQHVEAYGPKRALVVRYEDFVLDPPKTLERLAGFCGLDATPEALDEVKKEANPTRVEAWRRDPELSAFAESVKDRLAAHGY